MTRVTRMVEVPADVWVRAMRELRDIRANQAAVSAHTAQVLGELSDYSAQDAAVAASQELRRQEPLADAVRKLRQNYLRQVEELERWSATDERDAGHTDGTVACLNSVIARLGQILQDVGEKVE